MDPYASVPEVRRLRWLVRIGLGWAALVAARLIHLQVFEHENFLKLAESQQERGIELAAPRGTIFDRTGERLAVSVPVDSLAINPKKLKDPAIAAAVLSDILRLDERELNRKIREARRQGRGFLWVKRRLEPSELTSLMALKTEWMDFRRESRREYPHKELGAAVIGSVNHLEAGNSGVELTQHRDLTGTPGYARMLTDVRHRGVEVLEEVPARPGKDIALTIDAQLQFHCDRVLKQVVEENSCHNGTIVVMNPRNGEVLAMSSYPTFDPNLPPRSESEMKNRLHLAVSQALDPGSVFKMFTIATALRCTRLRPDSIIPCGNGLFRFANMVIHDTHSYGALPMEQVLWHSSNIGAINIGKTIGIDKLYESLHDFGFGTKTGIPLPGENTGILKTPGQCWPGSVYWMSIGHEVTTTTLQLAQACSVFANGGFRVKPKLILWKQREAGGRDTAAPSERTRVISPEIAIEMRKMSEGVVLYGTGKRARVKGYTIGGKTGTAQTLDEHGDYVKRYSSTFMGYGPVHDPAIVAVVTLNGSKKFGGIVAAPVFQNVMAEGFRILGEEPNLPAGNPPKDAPAPTAPSPAAEQPMLLAQAPPPAEITNAVLLGPKVPDFRGMNKRDVVKTSVELGMPVEMLGNGLARTQQPPAGSVLASGERIRVHFAR